eukprot:13300055-Alexandrium_andersonii.AAC.1
MMAILRGFATDCAVRSSLLSALSQWQKAPTNAEDCIALSEAVPSRILLYADSWPMLWWKPRTR